MQTREGSASSGSAGKRNDATEITHQLLFRSPKEEVKLYCFQCKTNICFICSNVEHKNHECTEIDKVFKELINQVATYKYEIQYRAKYFVTESNNFTKQKTKLIESVNNTEKLIRAKGEEVKRLVDKRVGELLSELESAKA